MAVIDFPVIYFSFSCNIIYLMNKERRGEGDNDINDLYVSPHLPVSY